MKDDEKNFTGIRNPILKKKKNNRGKNATPVQMTRVACELSNRRTYELRLSRRKISSKSISSVRDSKSMETQSYM